MTRRKKTQRRRDTHHWQQARVWLRCVVGGHDVGAGTWVRYRFGDPLKVSACEHCLKVQGITPPQRPTRPFTLTRDDGADVRSRQVGGDD